MAQRPREPTRAPALRLPLLLLLVGLGGASLGGWYWWGGQQQAPPTYQAITPARQPIAAVLTANGYTEPARILELSFRTSGRVREVLVDVGATVRARQPLARLDDRDLQLRASQAEARLSQAEATYQQLVAGASEAEIVGAQAQVRQARGQLLQIQGAVSAADLRAAALQLAEAQTQLEQLLAGPDPADVRLAEAQLQQASAGLETQRSRLSSTKTIAEQQLHQSGDALVQAQARYATAFHNWEYVQRTGNDPLAPERPNPTWRNPGNRSDNPVSDAVAQRYRNELLAAEAGMQSAERAVEIARVAYEDTRQAEISGLQAAESDVAIASTQLDQVIEGGGPVPLASARTRVASAEANLEKLRGAARAGALELAQGNLEEAQASLAMITADPRPADLAAAQAEVDVAQAELALTRLTLEEATIVAPFAGVVAEVNVHPGQVPTLNQVHLVLADFGQFFVDLAVDEVDVAQIQRDQPATLLLDALPDTPLRGVVAQISPLANTQNGVSAYTVRVAIVDSDPRLRVGMSATATITTDERLDALLVPRRAVFNEGGARAVRVFADPALCQLPVAQLPAAPALLVRSVQTGISDGRMIEIKAGLQASDCVYVEGVGLRVDPLRVPVPGTGAAPL